MAAVGAGFALAVHQAQISGAGRGAAGDDAVGGLSDGGVEVSHNSKTVCPELVEGPFFLATPIEKDCPSTSSGRTEFLGAIFFQSCQLAPSRSISAIDELGPQQTGRASCRERVCQYVSISVVAVSLKKKKSEKTKKQAETK